MEKEVKNTTETTETIETVPTVHVEESVQEKTGWMPNRTLILIIVLSIVTLFLLVLALNIQFPQRKINKTAVIVSHAYTNLAISAPVASGSASQSDITIATNSNKITAIQMELAYDPTLITITDITPGAFLNSPVVLLKKISPTDGRITYVLGINLGQKAVSGKGVVATIKFTKIAGQVATAPASIEFLPKTEVSADGELKSVLKTAVGIKFPLISPTPTPATTK